ncbi:ATP-binding protein [Pseudomonas sp. v388]|uniref:anti-sigma regulatory factor n=1 Tax=Pseudomonas sp. v388 TaxID=2479849 RepID=UPI000F781D65|nr:ATP-binding SpoIIE family protein phosphatase [Pseudomonas sp. v388]RRV07030.1 ATP-binding protein [Pseudomonas sp. v388]
MKLSGTLTQVLVIEDSSQVGHARRTAQQLAETQGFDPVDAGRVALAVTELASNHLKHATSGELHLRVVPAGSVTGIEIVAVDRGPGLDIQRCLEDGFSTGGTQGIGLGAISRQADVFDVHADARGTVILCRFYPRAVKVRDLKFGASQHSLLNDPACGDVWSLVVQNGRLSALVVDGLGHGTEAELAARAGEAAFARAPFDAGVAVLDEMHYAMKGTRGGAVAVAQFDPQHDLLRFVGIGNIGATVIGDERTHGLASHPGIVGLQFRKAQTFEHPNAVGRLLVMYSDGLQSRWNLRDYPGLIYRHPAVIAALLHRDFCRGRDDVTVLVIALEAIND